MGAIRNIFHAAINLFLALLIMLFMALIELFMMPFIRIFLGSDKECKSLESAFRFDNSDYLKIPIANGGGAEVGVSTWVITRVQMTLEMAAEKMFKVMAIDASFHGTIVALLALAVALYGIAVVLRVAEARAYVAFVLLAKMAFAYNFATNWYLFKQFVIDPVESITAGATKTVARIFSYGLSPNNPTGASLPGTTNVGPDVLPGWASSIDSDLFVVVDKFISTLFSIDFFKLVLATSLAGMTGWVFSILLILIMVSYLRALLKAMYFYLGAIITRYLLYGIAPLFVTFMLFKQTRSLFTSWYELIFSMCLQSILMFTFLGMMHLIIVAFFATIPVPTGASICYSNVYSISGVFDWLFWFTLQFGNPPRPSNEQAINMPLRLWSIICVLVLIHMIPEMLDFCAQVAGRIAGALFFVTSTPLGFWEGVGARVDRTTSTAIAAPVGALFGATDEHGVQQGGLLRGGSPLSGARAAVTTTWRAGRERVRRTDNQLRGYNYNEN